MDVTSAIGHLAILICVVGQICSLSSSMLDKPNFDQYLKLRNLLAFFRADENRRCDDRKIYRFNRLENDLIINLTKSVQSDPFFDYESLRTKFMNGDTHKLIEIGIISGNMAKFSLRNLKRHANSNDEISKKFSPKMIDWETTDEENLQICNSYLYDCILSAENFGKKLEGGRTELLYRINCDGQNSWEAIFVRKKPHANSEKAQIFDFVYFVLPLSSIEPNQCDNSQTSQNIKLNFCPENTKIICYAEMLAVCLLGCMVGLLFSDLWRLIVTHVCVFVPGAGFSIDSYVCCCRKRFFDGNTIDRSKFCLNGSMIADSILKNSMESSNFVPHCRYPRSLNALDDPVFKLLADHRMTITSANATAYSGEVVDSSVLRKILFSINILCGLIAFIFIFVAISHRRTQDWSARGWALMELFFLGAILLYLIVVLEYFEARDLTCCLSIWCREIGFALFYGPIVLKIYRNLIEHRVRKAHHVFVKEKDLLKYLLFIAVFTLIGLLAFTLTISDASSTSILSSTTILTGGQASSTTATTTTSNKRWLIGEPNELVERRTFPLVSVGSTSAKPDDNGGGGGGAGRRYFVCTIFKWNFAWQGLELILLLYGCYLTYKARNTSWVERKQFGFSVLAEILVTTVVSSVRYNLWLTTSPNTLLLLSFVQVHCTVTLSIAVILASKLYYANTDHSNRAQSLMSSGTSRAHPSLAKLRDNLVNGAIDFAEVPITEMNPEDIKAELKRVYTQLRMYKLTNLYADNPHISKRKGGKKSSSKQQQQQQQQQNQQGRRVSSTGTATTNANSSAVKNRKDHFKNKFEMEEKSSLARGNDDDSASVGSVHDLTVQSSMHNVYLSRTSLAAAKKLQLDSDLSVRI